jgi:LmbE family N-acetylglucosaminyl deacetylase
VRAPGGRIVVVSPHLDDAVLSLGATIAAATYRGRVVEVLTVFAGDPGSPSAAGRWDREAGYRTEGEAATARRAEDRRACRRVGAQPVWLVFTDHQYGRERVEQVVRAAVLDAVRGADTVLLPGLPLKHPDHRWLAGILLAPPPLAPRIGLYAEQPYAERAGRLEHVPSAAAMLRERLPSLPVWSRAPAGGRAVLAKWLAACAYRSQLPVLGLGRRIHVPLLRLLWQEWRAGGEFVAWLTRPAV